MPAQAVTAGLLPRAGNAPLRSLRERTPTTGMELRSAVSARMIGLAHTVVTWHGAASSVFDVSCVVDVDLTYSDGTATLPELSG